MSGDFEVQYTFELQGALFFRAFQGLVFKGQVPDGDTLFGMVIR